MENEVIRALIEQVPSLVVLAFIVLSFLKFLSGLKSTIEVMQKEMIETLKSNTEVLGKAVLSVQECKHVQENFRANYSG